MHFILASIYEGFRSLLTCFQLFHERTKISVNGLQLKINGAIPHELVTLRIYPLNKVLSEVRFWSQNKLIDTQKLKNTDLFPMHF